MNRPHRSIEIFTMSALDLFVTAMGSFAILMMILFPYFKGDRKKQADERQGHILVCAWPTRVKDYEQFKKDTEAPGKKEIKPEERRLSVDEDSWKEPGYEQGPDFPVVTVSWKDAQAFCEWLTKKERAAKVIGPEDEYRLPTLAEWKAVVGPDTYPWGNQWPPPPRIGNVGGEEFSKGRGYSEASIMHGYTDDHELAAPVGSYKPNRDGLYDVVGNVSIWLQEWYRKEIVPHDGFQDDGDGKKYRVYTGSAWDSNTKREFESNRPRAGVPEVRSQTLGFRCVLVIKSPPKS